MSKQSEGSAESQATQAVRDAMDRLEDAAGVDDPVEHGSIEDDARDILTEGVAHALADGLNKPVGRFARPVANHDEMVYYNLSELKQSISDRVETIAANGSEKELLDRFIKERLETVIIHRTTDHRQGAKYTWDFGNFQVQTESGKDGRGHYSWSNFRDYIMESGGVNLAKPEKDRRSGDDWREFVTSLMDDRGEVRRFTGPRTQAVEQLQNEIKRKTGYGTAEGALEYTGIWVLTDTVDVPDWWDAFGRPLTEERDISKSNVAEIRIHDALIEQTVDDTEITRSALYQELDARNHTVPGSGGPSMTEWIDGGTQRFWTVLPSLALPGAYVPDPNAENHAVSIMLESAESEASDEIEAAPDDNAVFNSVGESP